MTTSTPAAMLRVGLLLAAFAPLAASGSIYTQAVDLTESAIDGQLLDGLAARAVFTFDTAAPKTLSILLQNTSTGAPAGTLAAGQILTAISFDLGAAGAVVADPAIVSGSVVIGPGGRSINFDKSGVLSAGANVTGEWGYGNGGSANMLSNLVSAMSAHTTPFGGTNLDGPASLNGPQGGVVTNPPQVDLGGMGVVADSVIITLTLDKPLTDLSFLGNGVRAEFGSDNRFATVPEPTALSLAALGGLAILPRRR